MYIYSEINSFSLLRKKKIIKENNNNLRKIVHLTYVHMLK